MREQTMDLIRKSARQASAKLQFARLAFGAAGSAGAEIDLRDAERVARDFVQGGKHILSWQGPPVTLPKNKVKLLLNLLALGVVALPRGGTVNVEIKGEGPEVSLQGARARGARTPVGAGHGLLAGANGMVLDAHSIQPYYAGRVAAAAGMTVSGRDPRQGSRAAGRLRQLSSTNCQNETGREHPGQFRVPRLW